MLVAMADHICHPLLPSTQNMAYKKPNQFGNWFKIDLKIVKTFSFIQYSLDLGYNCVLKKRSVPRNSLGRGLFYVLNVLLYFKIA